MSNRRKNYDIKKVSLNRKNVSDAFKIFRYIRPHLGYFISGMALLIVGSLIFMVLMGIPGEMANVASGTPRFELGLTIQDFGKIMLVLLVLQGLFSYFRTVFFTIVSERGMADLRKDLYNTIMMQSITFFREKKSRRIDQ